MDNRERTIGYTENGNNIESEKRIIRIPKVARIVIAAIAIIFILSYLWTGKLSRGTVNIIKIVLDILKYALK